MSNIYTINVTNNSGSDQNFFIFQAPAVYYGGAEVYTNSLFQEEVAPYSAGGGVMQFQTNLQFYAGAQTQFSTPSIGNVSGGTTTSQPMNLTPASGTPTNNMTSLSIDPLALSAPTSETGVQPGAFRIVAPIYTPASTGNFNIGMATQGLVPGAPPILSNFIIAQPNQFVDCQPVLKFYVATGTYTPGKVVNFTSASNVSALCDATSGSSTFMVSYNADGTWTVNT